MRGLRASVGDALWVTIASSAVGLGFNALRAEGIPLVARADYALLVPCPVEGGEVRPLEAAAVDWTGGTDLLVDAREAPAAAACPLPSAELVPYDFLDDVDPARVAALVARPAARVVVVGDGGTPDSGAELGAELAAEGVRNVHHVIGGWPAARAHLGLDCPGGAP